MLSITNGVYCKAQHYLDSHSHFRRSVGSLRSHRCAHHERTQGGCRQDLRRLRDRDREAPFPCVYVKTVCAEMLAKEVDTHEMEMEFVCMNEFNERC
jgi:hypothetical protein